MQPSEALSASAQVAVTLAGFAGVVVAFRSRSVHEWSKIDKLRLQILLTNSATPFAMSILGMVLSSTKLDDSTMWRWCSLLSFVLIVWLAQIGYRNYRSFSHEEFRVSGARTSLFYGASAAGIATTLLQLYNVISLKSFWPFFVAIATFLLLGMLQFILLVSAGQESQG
jgi:hypothetical protein